MRGKEIILVISGMLGQSQATNFFVVQVGILRAFFKRCPSVSRVDFYASILVSGKKIVFTDVFSLKITKKNGVGLFPGHFNPLQSSQLAKVPLILPQFCILFFLTAIRTFQI